MPRWNRHKIVPGKALAVVVLAAYATPGLAGDAPLPEAARSTGDAVADWQLARMDDFAYVRTFRDETAQGTGWIQAAFYIGLTRWAEATGKGRYRQALLDKAEANGWRIGPRYWHADDQAIAQLYLALAPDRPRAVAHVEQAFRRVLAEPPVASLEFAADENGTSEGTCQRRWCWCDALFMAPPAWAMLSEVTGDPAYRDYALREYFATKQYLYDEEAHLFYRDSRFFDRRTRFGNRVFWSRGNGWVFAGLALLLEALPARHEARAELLELFREMAKAFGNLQHRDGYWASSLLDVEHEPLPETSGTAFITFGLAWGVNRGIIPSAEYGGIVERGWSALAGAVDEEGRLGWVQQVGNAPDEVRPTDTQLYGAGALLLAASELLRWEH